jgi:hypothetical protein
VNKREKRIREFISIHFIHNTINRSIDWKSMMSSIVAENHKNFQSINSYLFIGLESMRKIVFHSISLNRS